MERAIYRHRPNAHAQRYRWEHSDHQNGHDIIESPGDDETVGEDAVEPEVQATLDSATVRAVTVNQAF